MAIRHLAPVAGQTGPARLVPRPRRRLGTRTPRTQCLASPSGEELVHSEVEGLLIDHMDIDVVTTKGIRLPRQSTL